MNSKRDKLKEIQDSDTQTEYIMAVYMVMSHIMMLYTIVFVPKSSATKHIDVTVP